MSDIFMKKAEDFLEQAKDAFTKGRYDVAAFNAGQAAINANDALTMKFLQKRASKDHQEALKLNKQVVMLIGDSVGREYLRRLLDARRIYGYTNKICSKGEAETTLRDASKFLSWVRKFVKD